MTRAELSESIRQFSMKWANKGKEDEDDRSFWIDLFQRVLDVENATDLLEFQKKVVVNNTTKKIDVYIPDTKVIIEQKSNNKSLDEKIHRLSAYVLGVDETMLRKMMNKKYVTKDNINEFGDFDALKATIKLDVVIEYFKKITGEEISIPKANMRADKMLRDFILQGGFEIEIPE